MALLAGPYIVSTSRRDSLICWVTDNGSSPNNSNSEVRLGTSSNNLNMVFRGSSTVSAGTTRQIGGNYLHTVRVSGLQPGTRYFYSVGNIGLSSVGIPERFFYTSPAIGSVQPMRFFAIADGGNQTNTIEASLRYIGTSKVDLMLTIGDNAYGDGSWTDYRNNFFNPSGFNLNNNNNITNEFGYPTQLAKYTILPCQGNHDYFDGGSSYSSTQPMNGIPAFYLFRTPRFTESGGIAPLQPRFYSFDYGNVHFISLDGYHTSSTEDPISSLNPNGPQIRWLKNDLEFAKNEIAAGRKKWIIVFCHFPPFTAGLGHPTYNYSYPSSSSSEGVNFREFIVPLLHQYNVDLCLYGHTHNYQRSYFIHDFNDVASAFNPAIHSFQPGNNGQNISTPYNKVIYSGTVHVVMGHAGGDYYGTGAGGNYGGLMASVYATSTLGSGFGIIDITPNGGPGGTSDLLTYISLKSNSGIPTEHERFYMIK